VGASMV